jgi:hypothetical protein
VFLVAARLDPAAAQNCTGDCDLGNSVSVAEVVRGVTIALGSGSVAECRQMDRSGDDRIGIDELVEAVTNSVSGCPSQRVSRAASSVALSSVRTVLNFGSIASSGGGGGGSFAARQPTDSLQGGGAGSGCLTAFCDLGGTEQTCCFFGEVQITRDQCRVSDGVNTYTFSGFLSLASTDFDFDPCFERVPPFGSSFTLTAQGFTGLAEDSSGNFDFEMADYTEDFTASLEGTSCFPSQVDPFAFGIRGDGRRTLNGSTQRVIGNRFTGPTYDSTVTADGLTLDVVLSFDSFSNDCDVFTDVDGRIDGNDAITGVLTSQTYDFFGVEEYPGFGGTFFLGLNGDLITDCLGLISVQTNEFLELQPGAVCPVSGEVLIDTDSETTAVGYTSGGGVTFDVGADGSIEDARDSCLDLNLSECQTQQGGQTCQPCSSAGSCGSGFECDGCLFCEFADQRCVPAGEFVFCGDDLYGDFSSGF